MQLAQVIVSASHWARLQAVGVHKLSWTLCWAPLLDEVVEWALRLSTTAGWASSLLKVAVQVPELCESRGCTQYLVRNGGLAPCPGTVGRCALWWRVSVASLLIVVGLGLG